MLTYFGLIHVVQYHVEILDWILTVFTAALGWCTIKTEVLILSAGLLVSLDEVPR